VQLSRNLGCTMAYGQVLRLHAATMSRSVQINCLRAGAPAVDVSGTTRRLLSKLATRELRRRDFERVDLEHPRTEVQTRVRRKRTYRTSEHSRPESGVRFRLCVREESISPSEREPSRRTRTSPRQRLSIRRNRNAGSCPFVFLTVVRYPRASARASANTFDSF